MRIEIVHIGDELLTGEIDPFPKEMIEKVRERGASVDSITIIRDDYQDIIRLLRSARETGVDVLVITGGLGPTLDDITKQVVADFLERPLVIHPPAVEWFIEAVKRRYGAKPVMTDDNISMAMIPEGAVPLRNITGAAVGVEAVKDGMRIFCLPGFPKEMMPMFEEYILPQIQGEHVYEREIVGNRGESTMAPLFREIVRGFKVRIASLPTDKWPAEGNRIIIKGEDEQEVERAAQKLALLIEECQDEFESE
jgi:nicotinamide-nucleotide amidase